MMNVNWDRTAIKVADFKNNEVFYVISNKQILAVKILDSYIKFKDGYEAFLFCRTKTPLGNTFFDNNIIGLYVDREKNSQIYAWNSNAHCRYDVYKTIEDAQNNIVARNTFCLSSQPILDENLEFGYYMPHGCDDELRVYYYTYNKFTFAIEREFSSIYTLKRVDNGLILSNKFEPYRIPWKHFGSREEIEEHIIKERNSLSVISFDDTENPTEPEKVTITLDVDPNMPLKDIAELLYAKLHK